MDCDKIVYVFDRKISYTITFITLLYIVAILYMTTVVVADNGIPNVLSLVLLMLAILFFFVDNLCWQLNGKEIVSFEDNGILFAKKGRLLKWHRFIPYNEIDSIYCEQMKYSASKSWCIFWGRCGGSLKMEYRGTSYYYFGQSLSYNEAMQVLPEFKEHLNKFTLLFESRQKKEQDYYEKLNEEYLKTDSEESE
ncbi:MAG: hypothetical protein J5862_04330 [Bacteroidales bacterium]|nr:hypothetical protein [Bacteroidales bacterium]